MITEVQYLIIKIDQFNKATYYCGFDSRLIVIFEETPCNARRFQDFKTMMRVYKQLTRMTTTETTYKSIGVGGIIDMMDEIINI